MKPELLEFLKEAEKKVKEGNTQLKDNAVWRDFESARKIIDQAAANKNPLVKEYINIHR